MEFQGLGNRHPENDNNNLPLHNENALLQSPTSSDSGSIPSPPDRRADGNRAVASAPNRLFNNDRGVFKSTLVQSDGHGASLSRRRLASGATDEVLEEAPPKRVVNPYAQKCGSGDRHGRAGDSNTKQQSKSVTSKFFPRKTKEAARRRVTLDKPQVFDNARGGDWIDLTDDGPSEGQGVKNRILDEPPSFDYGEVNYNTTSNAPKRTRHSDVFDSWESSDELESPASSCKTAGSQAAVKPVSKYRLPPYRKPYKAPKKVEGQLERAFQRQHKNFSQESPVSTTNRHIKKIISQVQPKAKKQKTRIEPLSVMVFEREDDDF